MKNLMKYLVAPTAFVMASLLFAGPALADDSVAYAPCDSAASPINCMSSPDSDGDGLYDYEDPCPQVAGPCSSEPLVPPSVCETIVKATSAAVGARVGGPSGAAVGVVIGDIFGSALCG